MRPERSREAVLAFLKGWFAKRGVTLSDDLAAKSVKDDLALDSLDLMELFAALEESYGTLVDVDDYRERDLDVLGNLAAYVSLKGGSG